MGKIGKQYEIVEFCFTGADPTGSFVDVDLAGRFVNGGQAVAVKGFYAGNGEYRLRFLPEQPGEFHYEIQSKSLHLYESGTLTVEKADSGRHGPVRPRGTAMYYADGTWCPTFGTTVYALANQSEALIEETLESLKASPFNKLRTCVFPKHYAYNANNPRFYPFEKRIDQDERDFSAQGLPIMPMKKGKEDDYWNTARPNPAFWEHLEDVLCRLDRVGIQVDLILFHPYDRWGFSNMSREDNLRYLDYLLRRLAAFPNVWWSLANEYDLCFDKTVEDFKVFEKYTAENDPYHHPLSNHNCFQMWDAGSESITHVSFQTKELTRVAELLKKYGKPVLIDECRYEGNVPEFWGNLSGHDMTRSFWRVTAQGGYCTHGETFLPESDKGLLATSTREKDVIWWAKGGRLNGESPARIVFLRQIVEGLPGPLEPMDGGLTDMAHMDEESLKDMISHAPSDFQSFLNSIAAMNQLERELFYAVEYNYRGHSGEDAYLYYLDDQCAARYELDLPEGKQYRVEVLDTWEMTRETVFDSASGKTTVPLPGKPYMAILAVVK